MLIGTVYTQPCLAFVFQLRDDTPKPTPYKPHPLANFSPARPARTFPVSHEQNLPIDANEQLYNTRQSLPTFKKPTDYAAPSASSPKDQHQQSHLRVKPAAVASRFQPSPSGALSKRTTTTSTTEAPPKTSTAKPNQTPTSRRTRFNPYRSVVSPRTRVKSTTTTGRTTTTTETTADPTHAASNRGSIIRSQSQHYHSRPNLIARQPLFANAADHVAADHHGDDDDDDNDDGGDLLDASNPFVRQPLFKTPVQKTRQMNVPDVVVTHRGASSTTTTLSTTPSSTTPTTAAPATTTTSTTQSSILDQLLDDEDQEYDDDDDEFHPLDDAQVAGQPAAKSQSSHSLLERINEELADEVEYIRSNSNQLDASKATLSRTANTASTVGSTAAAQATTAVTTANDVEPTAQEIVKEPVILTSNFYLPESVQKNSDDDIDNGADAADDEYEEYDEDEEYAEPSTPLSPTSSTTTSTTPDHVSVVGDTDVSVNSAQVPTKPVDDDDEEEVLGEAVVSVVTTKSVINGTQTTSTAQSKLSPFGSSDASVDPEDAEYDSSDTASATEEEEEPSLNVTTLDHDDQDEADSDVTDASTAAKHADDGFALPSDSSEPTAANSSTENYLVVASVQTSRSVSGARYLPFAQVAQDEKKQVLDMMKSSTDDDDDDDDADEVGNDDTDIGDSIDPTTVPTVRHQVATTTTEDDTEVIESTEPTSATDHSADVAVSAETTAAPAPIAQSTESIIDKLDRVQSELSVGLLSGKFPILNEMPVLSATTMLAIGTHPTTTEDPHVANVPKAPQVVIRRFMPRSSTAAPAGAARKASAPAPPPIEFDELPMDDLTASLLPAGFKPRNNSYRNKKITTSTTTTTTPAAPTSPADTETTTVDPVRHRSANISRSFKTHPIVQDTAAPHRSDVPHHPFVPSSAKSSKGATRAPFVTVADAVNINQFLPPGYRPPKTTKKPSAFAVAPPSDFKPISDSNLSRPRSGATAKTTPPPKPVAARIPVADNIASFLPPGYKPPADEPVADAIPIAVDILSKLLPAGFNPEPKQSPLATPKPKIAAPTVHKFTESDATTHAAEAGATDLLNSVLSKVQFKEVPALLPAGFEPPAEVDTEVVETSTRKTTTPAKEVAGPNGGLKVVFPKGFKRPGDRGRLTTPAPQVTHAEGVAPGAPAVTIRKGPR